MKFTLANEFLFPMPIILAYFAPAAGLQMLPVFVGAGLVLSFFVATRKRAFSGVMSGLCWALAVPLVVYNQEELVQLWLNK